MPDYFDQFTPPAASPQTLAGGADYFDQFDASRSTRREPDPNAVALAAERERQGSGVGAVESFTRQSIPFLSSVLDAKRDRQYAQAMERFKAGQPSADDFETIVTQERRKAADERMQSTTLGSLVHAAGSIPAMVGEAYGAGKVLGLGGRALGLGQAAAPVVGGAMPTVLGSRTAAAAASYLGRGAAMTPLMPSMYLDKWSQVDQREGRVPFDSAAAMPTAVGLGYANVLVLGSLQKFGNSTPSLLGRMGVKGGIGVAEQAGVDTAAGVVDQMLPKAYRTDTKFGLIGNLARGEYGEAAKHATVQMFTFAAFAGMHDAGRRVKGEPLDMTPTAERANLPAKTVEAYKTFLDDMAGKKYSADESTQAAYQVHSVFDSLLGNPSVDVAAAKKVFAEGFSPAAKAYGESLVQNVMKPVRDYATMKAADKSNTNQRDTAGDEGPVHEPPPVRLSKGARYTELRQQGVDAEVARKQVEAENAPAPVVTVTTPKAKPAEAAVPITSEPKAVDRFKNVPHDDLRQIAKDWSKEKIDGRMGREKLVEKLLADPAARLVLESHPNAIPGVVSASPTPPAQTPLAPEIVPPGANAEPVSAPEAPKPAAEPVPAAGKPPGTATPTLDPILQAAGLGDRQRTPMVGENGKEHAVIDAPGGRFLSVQYHPDRKSIELDFDHWQDSAGIKEIPKAQSAGTMTLMRDLQRIAGAAREAGLGINYTASIQKSATGNTSRANLYEKILKRAGFVEQSMVEGAGTRSVQWRPRVYEATPFDEPAPRPETPPTVKAEAKPDMTEEQKLQEWRDKNRRELVAKAETMALDWYTATEADRPALAKVMKKAGLVEMDGTKGSTDQPYDPARMLDLGKGGTSENVEVLSRGWVDKKGNVILKALVRRLAVGQDDASANNAMYERVLDEQVSDVYREHPDWTDAQLRREGERRMLADLMRPREERQYDAIPEGEAFSENKGSFGDSFISQRDRRDHIGTYFHERPGSFTGWKQRPEQAAPLAERPKLLEKLRADIDAKRAKSLKLLADKSREELVHPKLLTETERVSFWGRLEGKTDRQIGAELRISGAAVNKAAGYALKKYFRVNDAGDRIVPMKELARRYAELTQSDKVGARRAALLTMVAKMDSARPASPKLLAPEDRAAAIESDRLTREASNILRPDLVARRAKARGETPPVPPPKAGGQPTLFYGQAPRPDAPRGHSDHAAEGAVGVYDLIATADKILGPKRYTEKAVPRGADAMYVPDARAVVTGKMAAGDYGIDMHERAHDMAMSNGFPQDANAVPPGVLIGLREFDYQPGRADTRTAMLEGMAEWFRLRQTRQLDPSKLSDAQKLAAEYAEHWLKDKKLDGKADRLRSMFDRMAADAPIVAMQNLLSTTGNAPSAEMTRAEEAATYAKAAQDTWQDAIDTNLGPLLRAEAHYEATSGKKLGVGERASQVYQHLMYAEKSRAGEFERDGVKALLDGKWVTVGQSWKAITDGARPEWLAPSAAGKSSKASAYFVARHLLGEVERGRTPVGEDTLRKARASMEEFRKDPEFMAWAGPFGERFTAGFDSMHLALERMGFHKEGTTANLQEKYPDYAPLGRVLSEKGWQAAGGTGRGEHMKKLLHERSGSDEQIVDPVVQYKQRLLLTAGIMHEHIRRTEAAKLLRLPEMAPYALENPAAKLTVEGKDEYERIQRELERLGLDDSVAMSALRDLAGERGAEYFRRAPWPADGTKPTFHVIEKGETATFRIHDRPLYDLLTNQQMEVNPHARLINAIANFTIPGTGIKPMLFVNKLVRVGATGVSLAFQARNMPRDAFEFFKNTVDRSTIGQLPAALASAFKAEWQVLRGQIPSNVMFRYFLENRGEQLRPFGFDRKTPGTTAYETKGIRNLWGGAEVLKNALHLMGAGELGPRYLEFKTRMEQLGWTEKRLTDEVTKANAAAAEGKAHVDPVPFDVVMDAMRHAAEVTVPFDRQGVVTREMNRIQPFFGPAVAGMSKAVRNWRTNAKGAALGLSGVLAARLLYWLAYSDEKWYGELSAHDRFNNFVVPTPFGLRRLPGPRDLEIPAGGLLTTALDAAHAKNPDFKGLLAQSLGAGLPPGVSRPAQSLAKGELLGATQEAAVAPLGPAATTLMDVSRNKSWMGTPIVPRRDEDTSPMSKLTEHQAPYAIEQLTGGRGDLSLKGAGLSPFPEVKSARRSVDDMYERLHELDGLRTAASRAGVKFEHEAEYQRLHHAEEKVKRLSEAMRGEHRLGRKVVKGAEPDEDKKRDLREKQIDLARKALGR